MTPRCRKERSNSGKFFTEQSVKNHELTCVNCLSRKWREAGLDINGRIKACYEDDNDDTPDGAYWAFYNERGGRNLN